MDELTSEIESIVDGKEDEDESDADAESLNDDEEERGTNLC